MSKICIATWINSPNYGTCLQAYALKKFLESYGHSVYFWGETRVKYEIVHPINWFLLKIKGRLLNSRKPSNNNSINDLKAKRIDTFLENFEVLRIYDKEEWEHMLNSFSLFVSGGDQIWNPYYLSRAYLLDFLYGIHHIKKISYASSIGVKEIPFYLKQVYKTLWREYDRITVREESALSVVKEVSGKKAYVVVDSTMLLNKSQWDELANQAGLDSYIEFPYVVAYFVGNKESYWRRAKELANEMRRQLVIIDMGNSPKEEFLISTAGPAEFINLIRNADMVITDSFHASVFSIKYHKNFFVLKRFSDTDVHSQNDRIYHLLSVCGIEDRLIDDNMDINVNKAIDYDCVDRRMNLEIEKSISYISEFI